MLNLALLTYCKDKPWAEKLLTTLEENRENLLFCAFLVKNQQNGFVCVIAEKKRLFRAPMFIEPNLVLIVQKLKTNIKALLMGLQKHQHTGLGVL